MAYAEETIEANYLSRILGNILQPVRARSLEEFSMLWLTEAYHNHPVNVISRSEVPFNSDGLQIYSTIFATQRISGRGIVYVDYHGKIRKSSNSTYEDDVRLKPALTLIDRVERLKKEIPQIIIEIESDLIWGDEAINKIKQLAEEKGVTPFL